MVVDVMKLGKLFVSVLVFVFLVFLFPTVVTECNNVNATLTVAPIIKVFPWILLVISLLIPIYLIIKEENS